MYRNLAAELVRSGVDYNSAAKELSITPKTFRAKMKGESDWTWSQVKALRKMVKTNSDIDYLFATDDDRRSA